MTEPTAIRRPRPGQRLYLRIYLALLASLAAAAILFGIAHMHADPPQSLRFRPGNHLAMLFMLMAIAVAVAIAAYPVVRRLTGRLERLQASVQAWGEGDLSARVAVEGRDEIAQLALSFNASAARVEALVGAQKTLLANASHELRSPLARIRMAVELLQASAPKDLRQELARNIAELDSLIGEVLLASRLEAIAEPVFETVDLAALVAEECARMGAACSAVPVEIPGEPALLRRMIRNLLDNAQRHGGASATRVDLIDRAPDRVELLVRDDGSGVAEGEREAIFEPFYRPRGQSEADGGYGLGLSLVRQIARKHGGDVCCIGDPEGGGAFRVTLPRRTRE